MRPLSLTKSSLWPAAPSVDRWASTQPSPVRSVSSPRPPFESKASRHARWKACPHVLQAAAS